MKCVFCGCLETKVVDSRDTEDFSAIRRRRECLACGKRFTSYEKIESQPTLVIKNDGSRQPFDLTKMRKGIIKACEKRPVSFSQIDEVCDAVSNYIAENDLTEIKTSEIGEIIMRNLKDIDDVSYVRFASVYRKFADLEYFKQFLNSL